MIARSFRYWLADLICGGALTAAHDDISAMAETTSELLADVIHARTDQWVAEEQAREATARAYQLTEALNRIAAMRTPGANGTVVRMAKVAQEAVK